MAPAFGAAPNGWNVEDLEKLNGSLSIDRDRLRFAEYKVRVLEERLRLVRIEKYGPGSEELSDAQLELLELEPGVSSTEVQAESERAQLQRPLKTARKHPAGRSCQQSCLGPNRSLLAHPNNASLRQLWQTDRCDRLRDF
jgi:hypothetical protein